MLLKRTLPTLCVAGVLLFSLACDKKKSGGEPTPTPTNPPGSVAQSAKARVRFKGDLRLAGDFSQILQIPTSSLCTELGQYSCAGDVHKIALGGVSPYKDGVYQPAMTTSVTTPLVVDRLALSACAQRVDTDFADSSGALIFRNLPVDADGHLVSAQDPAVSDSINTLVRRTYLRGARTNEYEALQSLYADVEAGGSKQAGRDWAVLSCFSVLTSMESLFY